MFCMRRLPNCRVAAQHGQMDEDGTSPLDALGGMVYNEEVCHGCSCGSVRSSHARTQHQHRRQEAMAIARLDLLFQQKDHLLRQLLSSNSHLLGVTVCEEARATEHPPAPVLSAPHGCPAQRRPQAIAKVGPQTRLNATGVVIGNARAAISHEVACLRERLQTVTDGMVKSREALEQYVKVNKAAHAEMLDHGLVDLALAKRTLWEVESALCQRITRCLKQRGVTQPGAQARERGDTQGCKRAREQKCE